MREKKFRRQTELQPQRTILGSHVKAVYCHYGQMVSQIFPAFYPMELGTSTRVIQKTVALRQLKTFRTLANSSLMYGHTRGVVPHVIKGRGQNGSHIIALGLYFLLVHIGSPYLFQLLRYKPTNIHQNLVQF